MVVNMATISKIYVNDDYEVYDYQWKSLSCIYALALPFIFVKSINLIKMEPDLAKQTSKINNVFVMLRHLLRVLPLRWMVSWSGCCVFFFSEMLTYAYYMIFYKIVAVETSKIYIQTNRICKIFSIPFCSLWRDVPPLGDMFRLSQWCPPERLGFTFPIWWACCSTYHQDPSSWKWRWCPSEVKSSLDILTSTRLENSSYDSNSGWQVVGARIL